MLYVGTVVTGSGPHAGDVDAPRNGLDPQHDLPGPRRPGLPAGRAHRRGCSSFGAGGAVRRAALVLLGVELAQGLIGFVQYFTDLPIVLVGLHMLGAACSAPASPGSFYGAFGILAPMSVYSIPWRRPFTGRDPEEGHRAATPLELFFDLAFVVAIAANASALHHDISHGHVGIGLVGYAAVFFAIWWAWLNYTWFASAYDTGDVLFRLSTFVIMTGVLILAAGTPAAQGEEHDFRILVVGYVVMRLAMIPLWLRAARDDPGRARTARAYAILLLVVQTLWVIRTWVFPHGALGWVLFGILVIGELGTPAVAEKLGTRGTGHQTQTPWHRHHVAERYELLTIIVLGEVLLAATQGISGTLEAHGLNLDLVLLIAGGLLTVFSMWWFYFKRPMVDCLREQTAFAFGYGHYFVFASVAAVGAGLGALVDVVQHEAHHLSERTALTVLAVAVVVYLVALSGIHALGDRNAKPLGPAVLVSVLLLVIAQLGLDVGVSVLVIGLVLSIAVGVHTARNQPRDPETASA